MSVEKGIIQSREEIAEETAKVENVSQAEMSAEASKESRAPQLKFPYKGEAPYIFISYAHKNGNEVYQIIAHLQQEGYRVWYDSGIDPGIEWAENIAARVSGCAYFIAFITKEYVASSNCQDELSYARDQEKSRLLVYLEDTTLPPGMSMRVNRLQAIHKYTYQRDEDFYEKLYMANGIKRCLFDEGEEGRDVAVNPVQPLPAPHTEPEQTQPVKAGKEKGKVGKGVLIGGIAAVAVAALAVLLFLPGKKNYYDMKSFAWNMTQEEAVAAWSAQPIEQGIADNGLQYVSYADFSVAGYDTSAMALYFAKDGLSLVEYRLEEGEYEVIFDDLYGLYGRPAGETEKEAHWETEEGYSIGVRSGEDGVCLYYQIPYDSYYDMQGFAFGMSREDAQKAAKAAGMIPEEDFIGIASNGSPYFRYESMPVMGYDALEGDSSFLGFDERGLCMIQYRLEDGAYGDIYEELETYYGEPVEKGSSVIWATGSGKYIRLTDEENRDVISYQNYQASSELELTNWNWNGITLNETSREETRALMTAAGFMPYEEASEGIGNDGVPWQRYEGGGLEIFGQKPYETLIWFNVEGANQIEYRFKGDIYQKLYEGYTAFYGEPDRKEKGTYIQWDIDRGGMLIISKENAYTAVGYYTKQTDGYWNLQGLEIGSTSLDNAKSILADAGLTPYKGEESGVDPASGMAVLSYQDVELMGHTAYRVIFAFDTNGFNRVLYGFQDGGYQDMVDGLVAYYGESIWPDGRNGWNMSGGRWLEIVKDPADGPDAYHIICAAQFSKGFYDFRGLEFGMGVEEVKEVMAAAGLKMIEESMNEDGAPFLYYGGFSYAGYEDCELGLDFDEHGLGTLLYKIPQAVYEDVCNSLDELYGTAAYSDDNMSKVWTIRGSGEGYILIPNECANSDEVFVGIF